ncbi:MAG: glycosyltransferase family 2 protein [Flavobacteriaceae bacterium]
MQDIELSIIIVNYNGEIYLDNCLNSINKYCSSMSYEVIVVDNNSSDNSISILKEKHKDVQIVESKKNLGFAGGNNIGVKQAKGEIILLLNNDTILKSNFSAIISDVKKENIGAVTIQMLDGDEAYVPSFGKFPSPMDLIRIANLNDIREEMVSGEFTKPVYSVDWISGSFLLVKKKDWELVNGLDEDYFMYVEDVDFCKKLYNLNKQILFYPEYSYIHFVGFNPSRELKLINGYKIYCDKHFNAINATIGKLCLNINYAYKRIFKNIR